MASNEEQPSIALVAIHGVGEQTPNESAQAVANLLLAINQKNYAPFRETKVRIATRRLNVAVERDRKVAARDREFTSRDRELALRDRELASRDELTSRDFSHELTQKLLSEYTGEGADSTYETVCLRGTRNGCAQIHIYDMYWADLSRLGTGLLRFFGAMFQLIFHLGDIGRQTAEFAEKHERLCRPGQALIWAGIRRVQVFAVWTLTCPLAVLNLYEFALALLFLPGRLSPEAAKVVSLALLLVIIAFAVGSCLFRWFHGLPYWCWIIPPIVIVGLIWQLTPLQYYKLLAFESCLVIGWILFVLLRAYSARRDDAGAPPRLTAYFSVVVGVLVVVFFISFIHTDADHPVGIYTAGLSTVELLYVTVQLFWLLLIVLLVLQTVLLTCILVQNRNRNDPNEAAATRAAMTVLVSLVHPTALFRVLTLALWAAMVGVILDGAPDIRHTPMMAFAFETNKVDDFVLELLNTSQTPAFTASVSLIAFALILSVWGMFPVVWAEIFPPRSDAGADDSRRRSVALGRSLNNAYSLLRVSAFVMFLAVPFMLACGYMVTILGAFKIIDPKSFLFEEIPKVQLYQSGLMSALLIGLLTLRGPFEKLALGFHSAVRVALDVDNYLRESPRVATPRARIFARFSSLLRHLCRWQDDQGRPYSAIIIVAHSQGTVITAELLRSLQKQDGDALGELAAVGRDIPIYFFTFGCPLRQLYGWRFPHLYQWARHDGDDSWTSVDPSLTNADPPPIPDGQKPDPSELGITLWVNAYRSGDYVGRYLWRPRKCGYLWEPNLVSKNAKCREVCVGAGAHTHYLDEPAIAKYLDQLIEEASVNCRRSNARE